MSQRFPKKTPEKEAQQAEESTNSVKQPAFKRKGGDQTSSQIRGTKLGKANRPSDRSFDQVSVSSNNKSAFGGNEQENEKMMVLSNEARQALISMQRFDRFIYVTQSQKKLKVPIEGQLKRLEKIKNSGNKLMKNTYFDNEITITCLYNHMKNLYEISKELGEIVSLKAQIEVLQQKIIEQNVKFNKQLKEASTSAKGKAAEDQQTLKQTLKIIETLITAMKEKNVEKGKKKIESDLKRATDTRKQLLELVHNLLGRVGGGAVTEGVGNIQQGGADIYQIYLQKLTQDQGSAQKNIAHLQSQKNQIEKTLKDSKSTDFKHVYTELNETCHYLISLNTTIKDTETSLLSLNKKTNTNQGMSEADKQKLKQFQQLQSLITSFEQEGVVWHKELELINIKVEKNQNFTLDLNKNKKLLNGKKQPHPTILSLVNSHLDLLELISSKPKDSEDIGQLQQKYNQVITTNETLENQIKKLKRQLEGFASNSKGQAEVTKFINLLQQALKLKEGEEIIPLPELQKIKKYIELNRRKIPEDFEATLTSIQILIKTLIENQLFIKQRDTQIQKNEQAQTKDLANLDAIIKTLEKLLHSNDPINDGFINKLRRNIEQNSSKIDKLPESPVNNIFKGWNLNITKLVQILSDIHTNSKSKGESESEFKHEIDQLRAQIKNKESELAKLLKSNEQFEQTIKKLQVQINQSNTTTTQNQSLIDDLNNTISQLERTNSDLSNKLKQNESKLEQLRGNMNQLKDDKESSKNNTISDLREKIEHYEKQVSEFAHEKDILTNQIQSLNLQVQDLNRQLALVQEQLNVLSIQDANKERLLQETQDNLNNIQYEFEERILSLTSENNILKETIEYSKTGAEGQKGLILTLTTESDGLRREIDRLSKDYSAILAQNTKLKAQLESLDNNKAQLVRLNRENLSLVQGAMKQKNEYEDEKSNLTRNYNQLNAEKQRLNGEKERQQRELDSIRSNYANLQGLYKTQTQRIQELERSLLNASESQSLNNKAKEFEQLLNQSRQQNGDLHVKTNNLLSQLSQLQNQNRVLESQLRDKTNEIQKLKVSSVRTTVVSAPSSQYDTERYLALKEENSVLKEQIVLRDYRIQELEQYTPEVSSISQLSTTREQEIIRRLQIELNQLRSQTLSQSRNSQGDQRLIQENRELSEAIRQRDVNLQNAIGDNEYLFNELNKYKAIQVDLQNNINFLNNEIQVSRSNTPVNAETSSLRQSVNNLTVEKSKLESDIRGLQRQLNTSRNQVTYSNNQIEVLKHKSKLLEETEYSQRRQIEDLIENLKNTQKNTESTEKVHIITLELNDLRTQNIDLKQKLRTFESSSRIKNYESDESFRGSSDRLAELLKEKLQYVKTIKSMQTLLHAKDAKLMQLYDQREIDLRHLIHENKKLQEQINRINERLVKQKVKILISPKSLEESLHKMESQLIDLKRQNIVLKEEIQTLEQQLIDRDRQSPHPDVKSSSSIGLDKNLYERVKILETEREKLIERVTLLNVYQKIETQSQALVSNVNKLIDGILVFLGDSQDFADIDFSNNEFLPAINEYLNNEDYEQYFENVQDLIKDLFLRVVGRKNQILDKQAQQLLLLREKMEQLLAEQDSYGYDDDSYSKSYYERPRRYEDTDTKKKASLIALQHLFKLYLKAKDPSVLKEISELLTISQGKGRYQY